MAGAKITFLALVGPTCIGKTRYAHEMIDEFPLELINLDSFQVYDHFRVGTGRSDLQTDRAHLYGFRSPHDVLLPEQYLSVVDEALNIIFSNHRRPLFEGGSISYIKALLGRYSLNLLGLKPADEVEALHLIEQRITSTSEELLLSEIAEGLRSGYQDTIVARDNVVYLPYVRYMMGNCSLEEARLQVRNNLIKRHRVQMEEYSTLPVKWFTPSSESLADMRDVIRHFLYTDSG